MKTRRKVRNEEPKRGIGQRHLLQIAGSLLAALLIAIVALQLPSLGFLAQGSLPHQANGEAGEPASEPASASLSTTIRPRLIVDLQRLPPGGQARFAVVVEEGSGQGVGGIVVVAAGAGGEVKPSAAVTDAAGRAEFTFNAGVFPGEARITAIAAYQSASTAIQIEDRAVTPEAPFSMHLPFVRR